MFLILGHNECPYCDKAKALLDKRGLSYKAIDLKKLYHDWRQIFTDVGPLIRGQRMVPLIFTAKSQDLNVPDLNVPDFPKTETLRDWEFIGDNSELEKYLFIKLGYDLDDDY
jgi:glutaredoxin